MPGMRQGPIAYERRIDDLSVWLHLRKGPPMAGSCRLRRSSRASAWQGTVARPDALAGIPPGVIPHQRGKPPVGPACSEASAGGSNHPRGFAQTAFYAVRVRHFSSTPLTLSRVCDNFAEPSYVLTIVGIV